MSAVCVGGGERWRAALSTVSELVGDSLACGCDAVALLSHVEMMRELLRLHALAAPPPPPPPGLRLSAEMTVPKMP